jgi:hypothetical protein
LVHAVQLLRSYSAGGWYNSGGWQCEADVHEVLLRVHAAGRRIHDLSEMRGRDRSEHDLGSVSKTWCNSDNDSDACSSTRACSRPEGMEMSGVRKLRHGVFKLTSSLRRCLSLQRLRRSRAQRLLNVILRCKALV